MLQTSCDTDVAYCWWPAWRRDHPVHLAVIDIACGPRQVQRLCCRTVPLRPPFLSAILGKKSLRCRMPLMSDQALKTQSYHSSGVGSTFLPLQKRCDPAACTLHVLSPPLPATDS
jgi:hypothetical protein